MPEFDTQHFGRIAYAEDFTILFPHGLPGFDHLRSFVLLSYPDTQPLVFLQSLEDPALCFITMPVLAADPAYRLEVSPEDLGLLGLPLRAQPRVGEDVLCLTVLSLREAGPTANLLAPIVVNLKNRRAVQALCPESRYSHRQPLLAAEEAVSC